MANILDKYGIKEVADVTFYEINPQTGEPDVPVLYLDTLKVSTIEQTAEEVSANGGKGNPPLVIWDYGKDITVTLEDALFSAKSMAILFGNSKVLGSTETGGMSALKRTISWKCDASNSQPPTTFEGPQGKIYPVPSSGVVTYNAAGTSVSTYSTGEIYYTTFDMPITNSGTITISANSFPGTYYITGDTYARSEASGADEFFQFIIPKAKVKAENTITLEAEGDPSVFNLNLHVMRTSSGEMMKLVKYDMTKSASGS